MKKKLFIAVAVCLWTSGLSHGMENEDIVRKLTSDSKIKKIHVQSQFSPLHIEDAPKGGAHPIGGPSFYFVQMANEVLAPLGVKFVFHVSGEIHSADQGLVGPRIVDISQKFQTIHAAVKAGKAGGGINAGLGLSNMNGFPFGELLVTALPFGMEPDEFIAYLYEGGGLELQQKIYNEKFDGKVLVIPIAVTPTQGGGWFHDPLPDPDTREDLSDEEAMKELCRRPIIVRWPEPGSKIWQRACANNGVQTGFIGTKTRCADPTKPCPGKENPVENPVDFLTFGGFVYGGLPQSLLLSGNIDAFELNLPYSDVMMMKLALGQWNKPNSQVDLNPIIRKAPYLYGSTWHQTLSYVELLFNRAYWDRLTREQRNGILVASKAASLANLAVRLNSQGKGLKLLRAGGAIVLRWPEGLLRVLKKATDEYLEERANQLAARGDNSYRRVLDHQRNYMSAQEIFWDFGDVNQGSATLLTSPSRK